MLTLENKHANQRSAHNTKETRPNVGTSWWLLVCSLSMFFRFRQCTDRGTWDAPKTFWPGPSRLPLGSHWARLSHWTLGSCCPLYSSQKDMYSKTLDKDFKQIALSEGQCTSKELIVLQSLYIPWLPSCLASLLFLQDLCDPGVEKCNVTHKHTYSYTKHILYNILSFHCYIKYTDDTQHYLNKDTPWSQKPYCSNPRSCSDLYLSIYSNCIFYILDFLILSFCHICRPILTSTFSLSLFWFCLKRLFGFFCYFCLALSYKRCHEISYNIMHSSPFFQEVLLDLALQRLLGVPAESRKKTTFKNVNRFSVLKSQRS